MPKTKTAAAKNGAATSAVADTKQIARLTDITETIKGKGKKHTNENRRILADNKTLKIAALGGMGEIGKNLYVYEYGGDIVLVDCGISFPDEEMFGVDVIIPDFTYLEHNAYKIRGLVLTHAHEDHIGAIPYLLKKINIPLYGTALTLGLVEQKLAEHRLLSSAKLHAVKPRDIVSLGAFAVEFIGVNHSVPDSCALALHTPAGIAVHTGDFKIDYTPIEGEVIDLPRFAELGQDGVVALMCESTNAERKGYTASERTVGESFARLFSQAKGKRIIVATFSSNIHRVQQIADIALATGRKFVVSGRSMESVISKARELGYLNIPSEIFVKINDVNKYPPSEIVIVTTGSQGEPLSALQRMSVEKHKQVSVTKNDYIIVSATPIPGNEKTVSKVINGLMELGAEVIYENMYDIHVSGHACREELKMMIALTRPKFFIPMHGEYKHLKKNAGIAKDLNIPCENIFIIKNGEQLQTDGEIMERCGEIEWDSVYIDAAGLGEVDDIA
ncbi:MAG: ribonuclease J, partial [Oscillospiraceae bacterium]|nr:ribonuclease J [Oscillospiraceae bacterium]